MRQPSTSMGSVPTDINCFNSHSSQNELPKFVALILCVYVAPVVLILPGVIPFSQRFTLLLGMAIVVFVVELIRGRSWKELGFRSDTLSGSLKVNLALSATVGAILLIAWVFGAFSSSAAHESALFYVFYVLISSPTQEFLFRSVVFAEMNRAKIAGARWQVGLSTLIYVFPHTIYKDALTVLVVAAIGAIWGLIYWRYPNIYGVALSHAALGAVSIAAGLI